MTHPLDQAAHRAGTPLLIYDGRCGFCRAQAARLSRLAGPRIVTRPAETRLLERFPGLTAERCMREIVLADPAGRLYGGAEAIAQALHQGHPGLGSLALAYYIPPIAWVADRAYRFIARHRYWLSGRDATPCEGGVCRPDDTLRA